MSESIDLIYYQKNRSKDHYKNNKKKIERSSKK